MDSIVKYEPSNPQMSWIGILALSLTMLPTSPIYPPTNSTVLTFATLSKTYNLLKHPMNNEHKLGFSKGYSL